MPQKDFISYFRDYGLSMEDIMLLEKMELESAEDAHEGTMSLT